jgi:DNA-binding response OmpR family regulator
LKQVLKLRGYQVVDTDNGRDAVRNARQTPPDLLVVDMEVPLLYGLVAARQIIKNANVGLLPVVIVTHDDIVDPAPMIELGATRNEYVTRLSNYEELQPLLDYLLPIYAGPGRESLVTRDEITRLPPLGSNATKLHPHRGAASGKPDSQGQSIHSTWMWDAL